ARASFPAVLHTRVLLRTGDVPTDGLALSGIERPVVDRRGAINFLGTTKALVTEHNGSFAVVARTGDPLPPPLSGTFGAFSTPVINDRGAIAFAATVSAASADTAIFLYDQGTFTTVEIGRSLSVGDLNNESQVIYRRGSRARSVRATRWAGS